jgi:hypothetical protein
MKKTCGNCAESPFVATVSACESAMHGAENVLFSAGRRVD